MESDMAEFTIPLPNIGKFDPSNIKVNASLTEDDVRKIIREEIKAAAAQKTTLLENDYSVYVGDGVSSEEIDRLKAQMDKDRRRMSGPGLSLPPDAY